MRNGVSVYVKPIRYLYAFYVAPLTRIFTHVKKFFPMKNEENL